MASLYWAADWASQLECEDGPRGRCQGASWWRRSKEPSVFASGMSLGTHDLQCCTSPAAAPLAGTLTVVRHRLGHRAEPDPTRNLARASYRRFNSPRLALLACVADG
jgi:hypothetical protein